MIFVALGTFSSGSTWTFNVIREIVSTYSSISASTFCDIGEDLLGHICNTEGDLVIKSHTPNRSMIRLLKICGAKIILTTRDPRDSFVSMSERFAIERQQLMLQISCSFSAIAEVAPKLPCMALNYEDGFTDDPDTVVRLAQFMGVDITSDKAKMIFERLRPDFIKSKIKKFSDEGRKADWFDPATHWHPNHLGDGKNEKWKDKLPAPLAGALFDAFNVFRLPNMDYLPEIVWRPELFSFRGERQVDFANGIDLGSEEGCVVWGPYLSLPAGRWSFEFLLSTAGLGEYADIQVDVVVGGQQLKIIGMHRTMLPGCDKRDLTIEFEHVDHLMPIEARVSYFPTAGAGRLLFSGIKILRVRKALPSPNSAFPILPFEDDATVGHAASSENERGVGDAEAAPNRGADSLGQELGAGVQGGRDL